MPATQTIISVSPTHSQVTLVTLIKNAFAAAGFDAPYADTTVGTDKIIVYRIISDVAKTYGTAYLRIKIASTRAISQTIGTNYNLTTNVLENPSTESTATIFVTNIFIEVRTFAKASEFRFVVLSQGSLIGFYGYLKPQSKHPCFDEEVAPYLFQSANVFTASNHFVSWVCTAITPYYTAPNYTTTFFTDMASIYLATANPVTNKRDSLGGMILYPSSNQGIAAKTSDDIIMLAASGLTRFDLIQVTPGIEEYTLIFAAAGSMAIRTT